MIRLFSTIAILLLSTPVFAEEDYQTLGDYRRNAELYNDSLFVTGLFMGFHWSNVAAQAELKAHLYCIPAERQFGGTDAEALIQRAAADPANSDDKPIALVLLKALQQEFPCS